jgi:hypothetical protein
MSSADRPTKPTKKPDRLRTLEVPREGIERLLAQCDDTAVQEMFDLGKALLADREKRMDGIIARGTTLIGFSGAMLAFLLTGNRHAQSVLAKGLLGIGGVLAAVSAILAFLACRSDPGWQEMSEPIWFEESSARGGANALRRYYLRALHIIHQGNQRIIDSKAQDLAMAQRIAAIAAAFLASALLTDAFS